MTLLIKERMSSRPTVFLPPSPPSAASRASSPQPRSPLNLDLHVVLIMFTRCLTMVVIAGNVLFLIYLLYLGRPNEIMNDSYMNDGTSLQYLDQMIQDTIPVSSFHRDLATTTHAARQISSPLILLHAVAPRPAAAVAADQHRSTTTIHNPAHLRVRHKPERRIQK